MMWPRHRQQQQQQQPLLATAVTLGCLLAIILVQPALSLEQASTPPAHAPAEANLPQNETLSDSSPKEVSLRV